MTAEGKRYVDLVEELKTLDPDNARYKEICSEADLIWWTLDEAVQDEIDGVLSAIDEAERTGKGPPAE